MGTVSFERSGLGQSAPVTLEDGTRISEFIDRRPHASSQYRGGPNNTAFVLDDPEVSDDEDFDGDDGDDEVKSKEEDDE